MKDKTPEVEAGNSKIKQLMATILAVFPLTVLI